MHDRVQIIAACLAHLRKVASAHPDGLAKPLGVSTATLIPILATDRRFARVAGPGGWWWKLAAAPGVTSATSLDDLQGQLAAAQREVATLKAEVARLSAPPPPTALEQQYAARGVDYLEVIGKPIVSGSQPGMGKSTATEQIVPGNSRSREPGGWFAAVLRRLGGAQTIGDIAAADQRNLKAASVACANASKKGLIEQVGKRGRAVLWRLKGPA